MAVKHREGEHQVVLGRHGVTAAVLYQRDEVVELHRVLARRELGNVSYCLLWVSCAIQRLLLPQSRRVVTSLFLHGLYSVKLDAEAAVVPAEALLFLTCVDKTSAAGTVLVEAVAHLTIMRGTIEPAYCMPVVLRPLGGTRDLAIFLAEAP